MRALHTEVKKEPFPYPSIDSGNVQGSPYGDASPSLAKASAPSGSPHGGAPVARRSVGQPVGPPEEVFGVGSGGLACAKAVGPWDSIQRTR